MEEIPDNVIELDDWILSRPWHYTLPSERVGIPKVPENAATILRFPELSDPKE